MTNHSEQICNSAQNKQLIMSGPDSTYSSLYSSDLGDTSQIYGVNHHQSNPLQQAQPLKGDDRLSQSLQTANGDTLSNSSATKMSPQIQSFHNKSGKLLNSQRLSSSSLDSTSSIPLVPINAKAMLMHGIPGYEVMRNWLVGIDCEDLLPNFVNHGYDIHLVTRMTPQDLAAVGCKSPAVRKKLMTEIRKLNINDNIPEFIPATVREWLDSLKLPEYLPVLIAEQFDTIEKLSKLTWEDMEEIGIVKLGHQKKLLLGLEKIKQHFKSKEERQISDSIYDVQPNHRLSLGGTMMSSKTTSRVRSGFFHTRSAGSNLDHRGQPVATVKPALKHVKNSISQTTNVDTTDSKTIKSFDSERHESVKMNEIGATIKRTAPPLPPVRTNSLTIANLGPQPNNFPDVQPIYGNNNATIFTDTSNYSTTNSTSFLRVPKLGTLTATTNKMLTVGGHIQTLRAQHAPPSRIIAPVREAPLPPVQIPMDVQNKIEVESIGCTQQPHLSSAIYASFSNCDPTNSSICHQLASADEFPPPPTC